MATALRVTWAGHSTVLIELDGVRLLTDPVLGARIGPLTRIARPVEERISSKIDAVVISHLHSDHAHIGSLLSLGASTRVLAPRGAAAWLRGRGLTNVQELGVGEPVSVGPVALHATPAEHDGRRWPLPHRWQMAVSAEAIGVVVRGTQACYFAGDTDLFDDMATLPCPIDLALLPVWGWGPTLGPGHLDPDRAATAARLIGPRVAVPIHWGTLALSRPARPPADPELPARRFAELVAARAPGVEVRLLAPGDSTQLSREPGAGNLEAGDRRQ